MGIQDWSEDIILVNLSREPGLSEDLKAVIQIVGKRRDCDVVIDFAAVEIITSSSLASLLKLRKALKDNGRRLTFCGVTSSTRNIFTLTGLDGIFQFADDQFIALASMQMAKS
ncbi:MAG TPA: STAS domain-containing protein [Sedimentisphaerales bacterium]|nr:STAS domain-containing protein [Sedimentisphaerales bacterium]